MFFHKITIKDPRLSEIKLRLEKEIDIYYSHEQLRNPVSSGRANSYRDYFIRLLYFIEEINLKKIESIFTEEFNLSISNLYLIPEFISYNISEGRFPSAAIKSFKKLYDYYSQFDTNKNIEVEEFEYNYLIDSILQEKVMMGKLINEPKNSPVLTKLSLSIFQGILAKTESEWTCEIDKKHKTFISTINNKPYVEAHHIIPLSYENYVANSLNSKSNLICLCPICHKKIHYSVENEKADIIETIYRKKHEAMEKANIIISLQDLQKIYIG